MSHVTVAPPIPAPALASLGFERLVVVSHRLPVAVETSRGAVSARRTVGGLVSGVDAFLRHVERDRARPVLWIGWAGPVEPAVAASALATSDSAGDLRAVAIEGEEHARFYEGFSNRTLWPLCHSFPSYAHLSDADWESYRRVNERFREAVLERVRPGDAVWIHDYQLMLLPGLLRERAPDLPIAYFHHIPFPPLDILRILPDPWARALLSGLLGADVVGFHTYDDVRKMTRAAERLLSIEPEGAGFSMEGRSVHVDAFPIGIDFERWNAAADDPAVRRELDALVPALEGLKVIVSIDRLDYTKGILNRLLAFERLLESEPEWLRRVTMLVVAVPSRVGVDAYRTMRRQIDEAVGRINGRYGTPSWTPVVYQYKSLDPSAVAARYLRGDIALVTPLRDGMNLIAKEYLATRRDEAGVLVLSDTAGAARELGEALMVNPFHLEGIAGTLGRALRMPEDERLRRCRHMRARIGRYDAARWGLEQCLRLREARSRTLSRKAHRLGEADHERLRRGWRASRERLVILDYDGTLVPFTTDPARASPDAALLRLLAALGGRPGTSVVVMSGRDEATLSAWFGAVPVALAAEHGGRVRGADGRWSGDAPLAGEARQRVLDLMQVFADRLPGSFVEPKDLSLAWHWRGADPEIGAARCVELVEALRALGGHVQVLSGKRVVEARAMGANKGVAARRWLARRPWDFVLAAGDDTTDEDLFAAVPEEAWTLRVGPGTSRARFSLDGPPDLRRLLADLAGPEAR